MEILAGSLLQKIDSPDDLKKLNRDQLHQICAELRQYIIDVVSVHGGHFAASLGVVELSVALHYVYNTPFDQLVWDVVIIFILFGIRPFGAVASHSAARGWRCAW